MSGNYFKIAWRNLLKNKVFSIVNILGLSIGMTCCFFLFLYVPFEQSYENFHAKAADLYRVSLSSTGIPAKTETTATNHPAVGPTMKADFPEVADFSRFVHSSIRLNGSMLSYTDKKGRTTTYNEPKIYFADPSFLRMFSFPFIDGNPATALEDGNSIAVSASIAAKYFSGDAPDGRINAIGKTLYINGDLPFKVTGVFKDVPENSHVKFDILISFNLLGKNWGFNEWTFPEFYNYILVAPGTDPKKMETKFPAFINKYMGSIIKEYNMGAEFHLQPITDIHLHSHYSQEAEANGSDKEIWLLSIIGIFILIIAWVNYINLSTARSIERAKEVGVRKVAGASRIQLVAQFIMESVIVNILAFIVTGLIVIFLFPYFDDLVGKHINIAFLSSGFLQQWYFWFIVAGIFITGACLVGAYPAWIFSAYKPALVLKGRFFQSTKGIAVRKFLVSFQFLLSVLLIAGTITVYRQLSFMQNRQLGYDKEMVLVINGPGIYDSTYAEKIKVFKNEILKNPAVNNITGTSEIPGKAFLDRNGVRNAGKDRTQNFNISLAMIDDQFINTFKIKMAAGRSFGKQDISPVFNTPVTRVLINEIIVKSLGFRNNEEAIGKRIVFALGSEDITSEIIGVVKNYHQRSLKESYDPILYFYPDWTNWKYYAVRINPADLSRELVYFEKKYKEIFPGNAFEYFFLDEYFNRQYAADQRFGRLFILFTILAIFVACLGLYGLSNFFISVRTKEVGIRKVMGASVYSILVLFSKEFILLVALSAMIAIPVFYFVANNWLANYAFHIQLNWISFVIPPSLLLIISLTTVGIQSIKTAMANPVDALRSE